MITLEKYLLLVFFYLSPIGVQGLVLADARRIVKGNVSKKNLLYLAYSDVGFQYVAWFRFTMFLRTQKKHHLRTFIAGKLYKKKGYLYGFSIPIGTSIGEGLRIAHYSGVVLAQATTIGKNCTLHQNVTLGRTFGVDGGCPIIGDNVIIFPGAIVVGNVQIANNVIVAPNAVVTKSVPENEVVGGIPAKTISKDSHSTILDTYKIQYFA